MESYKIHKKNNYKRKAFTLIELLSVMVVVGILATIVSISAIEMLEQSRDANRLANAQEIEKGLNSYFVREGKYPYPDGPVSTGQINGTPVAIRGVVAGGVAGVIGVSAIPRDPKTKDYYVYGIDIRRKHYQLGWTYETDIYSFGNSFGFSAYANEDEKATLAGVVGNYKGVLLFSSGGQKYVSNVPSLLFFSSAGVTSAPQVDLLGESVFFIMDKGPNIPYTISEDTRASILGFTGALQYITQKDTVQAFILGENDFKNILEYKGMHLTGGVSTEIFLKSFQAESFESLSYKVYKKYQGVSFLKVAAGWHHTCAIRTNGKLYCWGQNDQGQLGLGFTGSDVLFPTLVDTGSVYIHVTAGSKHTCAIKDTGKVYCWGLNDRGQLGLGDSSNRYVPTEVDGNNTYVSLSSGEHHTCGIRTDGKVYCWGANGHGQLGVGDFSQRHIPILSGNNNLFIAISSGGWHTCGIALDGKLYCWGRNESGQLGLGYTTSENGVHTPSLVDSGSTYTFISAGNNHTCGIKSNKKLYCWGGNGAGQLGIGNTVGKELPQEVGDSAYIFVNAGDQNTCAVNEKKQVYCWGANNYMQLGIGNNESKNVPTPVNNSSEYESLAGVWHNCGITKNNTLYCWGRNDTGQLGTGDKVHKDKPTLVKGQ